MIATNGETAKQARTLKDLIALSRRTGPLPRAGPGVDVQPGLRHPEPTAGRTSVGGELRWRERRQPVPGAQRHAVHREQSGLHPAFHFATGLFRAAGFINTQRYAVRDVPAEAEAVGYGLPALLWTGFFVPEGTPAAVVDRINRDVRAVFAPRRNSASRWRQTPLTVPTHRRGTFAKEIREETAIWQDLFKTLNIRRISTMAGPLAGAHPRPHLQPLGPGRLAAAVPTWARHCARSRRPAGTLRVISQPERQA